LKGKETGVTSGFDILEKLLRHGRSQDFTMAAVYREGSGIFKKGVEPGIWGMEAPSVVQVRSSVRRSGAPEAEAKCEIGVQFNVFLYKI